MRAFALRDHLRTEQLIHDIRCPLSAIRGYAQLLRYRLANDRASAADVEDGLRRIVESAKRVDDLLDLLPGSLTPWISAGVRREPTELVQLARRVAADCEAAYGGRSPVVVLSDVAELVGWLDAVRLERMLANLISNALKYNRDGRPVIVTLQRDGDLAVLSVADQGIGIPAEELPRVFERGYRASNVASAADGLGLGLTGAKETVTELRGTIEVESQESVGTTVTVRLPLGEPPASTTAPLETPLCRVEMS